MKLFYFLILVLIFPVLIQAQDENPTNSIYTIVDVDEAPRFPGCEYMEGPKEKKQCSEKEMLKFIYTKIKYPRLARENDIEGIVVVSFIVEKDGSIDPNHIEATRGIGAGCDQEAMRVIAALPQFISGKQDNLPVRVQFNLPIRFNLDKDNEPATRTYNRPVKYKKEEVLEEPIKEEEKEERIRFTLKNNSVLPYIISVSDTEWLMIPPRSEQEIDPIKGYNMMYSKSNKAISFLTVTPKLEDREVDIRKTIKTGILHISKIDD